MIRDGGLMFTGVGTSGYAPTLQQDNIAPNTIDTAPLGLPSASGGASTPGYNAGVSINAGRDLGLGGEMWVYALTTVTATSGGAATVQFILGTDATATLASFASSTGVGVLISSAVYALATLVAGFRWAAQLPQSLVYLEFLGLSVTIGTTTLTAGTFESGLVVNLQASDLYDTGFTVA